MIGSSWRSYANTATSCGWVAGYITLPLLAYVMQDMHQLEIVIGLSMFPILLLIVFCHPESPKWLLTVGKLKKAAVVLNRAAAWNQLPAAPPPSCSSPSSIESSSPSSSLFSLLSFPRQLRCLLLMCFCWLSFGMAYFGIALHTPEFGSNVFLVFFIGGVMDLPVLILTPCLLNSLGRRCCLTGGLTLGAGCLILSSLVPSGIFHKEWPVITLAILGKVSVSQSKSVSILLHRWEWVLPLTQVMYGPASFSPLQSGILLFQPAPHLPGFFDNSHCLFGCNKLFVDWVPLWLHCWRTWVTLLDFQWQFMVWSAG